MDYKHIYDLLKTLTTTAYSSIPVAYDHFQKDQNVTPPFIAYREISPETFKADGLTYYRPYEFEIELVTDKKDVDLEKALEKLLTDNSIPYDMLDETWDSNEQIYHIFYEI